MSAAALALSPRRYGGWLPFAIVVAAALVVGLLAWMLLRDDTGESPSAEVPRRASVEQLRDLSTSVGHDLYWAGAPAAGTALELTHQSDGRIYVRYLSADGEIGDDRPRFTTIGTYPVANALIALSREAKRHQAITRDLPAGGLAVMNVSQPTSVYLAWPGSGYEVEVFDPSPKHALDLVLSGAVAPVD